MRTYSNIFIKFRKYKKFVAWLSPQIKLCFVMVDKNNKTKPSRRYPENHVTAVLEISGLLDVFQKIKKNFLDML